MLFQPSFTITLPRPKITINVPLIKPSPDMYQARVAINPIRYCGADLKCPMSAGAAPRSSATESSMHSSLVYNVSRALQQNTASAISPWPSSTTPNAPSSPPSPPSTQPRPPSTPPAATAAPSSTPSLSHRPSQPRKSAAAIVPSAPRTDISFYTRAGRTSLCTKARNR
jgi:hypothetical protein